jgi:tetratricopeptide (TPR) repeat protein
MGTLLHAEGKIGEAKKLLEKAMQIDPNNFLTYVSYGDIYDSQRKYEEAIKWFLKARELN